MDVVTVMFVQGYVTYSLPWPVTENGPGKNGPAGPIFDSFTIIMVRSDHSCLI